MSSEKFQTSYPVLELNTVRHKKREITHPYPDNLLLLDTRVDIPCEVEHNNKPLFLS